VNVHCNLIAKVLCHFFQAETSRLGPEKLHHYDC
jgi:hypothetical protein